MDPMSKDEPVDHSVYTPELIMAAGFIELVIESWISFEACPMDEKKFKDFDWTINVALAKWQTYADIRKATGA